MKETALFTSKETIYGKVYFPANRIAVNLARIAGVVQIPEDRLPFIRALGFEIAEPNGQPIPHPWTKVDIVA